MITTLPLSRQRHRGGGRQSDALVGGAEQHVEFDARVEQGLGVELGQLAQRGAVVEQARIEEIRRLAACLGEELAELQHFGFDGKRNELLAQIVHDLPLIFTVKPLF
jgi:hypothetical protein